MPHIHTQMHIILYSCTRISISFNAVELPSGLMKGTEVQTLSMLAAESAASYSLVAAG